MEGAAFAVLAISGPVLANRFAGPRTLPIVIGLTAMYFAGESLNIITLLGLMICVGLLVDNSVVVAENIHRMHREGLNRRDACIREEGLAVRFDGSPGHGSVPHGDNALGKLCRAMGRLDGVQLPVHMSATLSSCE